MLREWVLSLAAVILTLLCLCLSGCREGAESGLERVRQLHQAGDFDDAISVARSILDDVPGHPEASYWLGLSLLRSARPSPAVFPLRKAFEDAAFERRAGVALANALLSSQSFDAVIRVTDELLRTHGDLQSAWVARSLASLELRDSDDALEATSRLLALDDRVPQNLHLRALALRAGGRAGEAAEVWQRIAEVAGELGLADLAAIACVEHSGAVVAWESDPAALRAAMEPMRECARRFPDVAVVIETLARLHFAVEEDTEGLELLRGLVEHDPSLPRHLALARQLVDRGRTDEAGDVLRAAAADAAEPRAWAALADFQREQGEVDDAVRSMRRVSASSDRYRFAYADLLVEAGELEAAAAAAESLEDPAFRELIRGRLLLEQGDHEAALSALETGLGLWPDNVGARVLAARAAEEIGDSGRAMVEYRESIRADAAASDAGLAGARLALALGRYQRALEFAGRFLARATDRRYDALVICLRAAHALEMDDAVEMYLKVLESEHGAGSAVLERARALLREGAPAEAARAIEMADLDLLDAENEDILRTLVEAQVLAGEGEAAEAFLTRAISEESDRAELWAFRGRARFARNAFEPARADLERAVELDAGCGSALAGLGALELRAGNFERALELYARAADADPDDVDAALSAAQIARDLGRRDEAERGLRRVLRRDRGEVRAANDLAWMLAEDGRQLDEALGLARIAVRLAPSPGTIDTLGYVLMRRGEETDAISVLEEGATRHAESELLRERLGLALEAARRRGVTLDVPGDRPDR